MRKPRNRRRGTREKRVDETTHLSGRRRGAILKFEVWYEGNEVVKYSLAYVNPLLSAVDNGRILGYDCSHGKHHRHLMGRTEPIVFRGYDDVLSRFQSELAEIWKGEDETR